MSLITSRTGLNQGSKLSVAAAIFATGTGADIRIHTSAANNLPALAANEYFEVRDHSVSVNNGLYQVVTVNTSTDDYECNKITAGVPSVQAAEVITTLGATGVSTEKSIHLDVATLTCYGIEQGNMTSDGAGANGDALYSFFMQEYKDDNFLISNSPFPMNAIDKDAGKYIMGQDSSGNSNGWTFGDLLGEVPAIRTRRLWRNMGWNEINAAGVVTARYFCAITLGVFEDAVNDNPFGQFGTDSSKDDTFNFIFNGPANEAIKFAELIGDLTGDTPAFASTTTFTRVSGSFITDGFVKGGQIDITNSTSNDGTYEILSITATTITITTTWTAEAIGTTTIGVNNDNAFKVGIRVRDGDPNGKTFGQSNLAGAGKTVLGNFVFSFPLANATDLKISETDANIDSLALYTGMSLTLNATGQSRGGLVGGPYNFSMIIDGNNGTNIEVFEWLQRQLRKNSDIDAGGTNFGRALELMARFNGDTAEFGSPDGGVNFPYNPESDANGGLFVDNLNAASDNATKFWDDTGNLRSKPESIAVTLDGNSIILGDTASEYDLFFDRTIRTAAAALTDFVLTNATSKITSAGSNLPTNSEIAVNKFIRISGLTGGDAAMNGAYQITAINSAGADWTVVRYDNAAIVDVTTTAVDLDQNCVDTPDSIIVHTNVNVATASDVSFTAADTITSAGSEFGVFAVGDRIEIEGSTGGLNDGLWEILTASATTLTVSPERIAPSVITTQATGPTVTITKLFSGDFDIDVVANFAFDDNVQGGRTVSTTTFVLAKAIGQQAAQYIPSPVSQIASGTPVTIPLFASTERNVT